MVGVLVMVVVSVTSIALLEWGWHLEDLEREEKLNRDIQIHRSLRVRIK